MPKNKGKGGKNRRRGKNESDALKRELEVKEEGQGKLGLVRQPIVDEAHTRARSLCARIGASVRVGVPRARPLRWRAAGAEASGRRSDGEPRVHVMIPI